MAKKEPKQQNNIKNTNTHSPGLLLSANNFFSKNAQKLFWICFALSVLFTFLQFDVKISIEHDDALYVQAGYQYLHDFPNYYYTANAPFYPMLMGIFIWLFGLNLIALKIVSALFMLGSFFFFYKAFRPHLPALVLYPVLLIIVSSPLFIHFACMTFTEGLWLLIQALYFVVIFKIITNTQFEEKVFKNWKLWLLAGLLSFLLVLTKSVSYAIVPAALLYFLLQKQFKNLLAFLCSFGFFFASFAGLKKIIWGTSASNVDGQMNMLLQKDPYDASMGNEDLSGFIVRFFENVKFYTSRRFFQIVGLQDDLSTYRSSALAALVVLLVLWGTYQAFKNKNKFLLFAALHSIALVALSFIMLQTKWDQPRIVMIHVPVMLCLIFYGLYQSFYQSKYFGLQFVSLTLIIIVSLSTVGKSLKFSAKNFHALSKNIKGDIYYGYTPDWVNYLKMSVYCAENLAPESLVACRKAPMSFIYTKGHKFYPVYRAFSNDPDSILASFKKAKVSHILVASLRMNPYMQTENVINTMHRLVQPIVEKYPNKLELVQTIGESEPAYLLKINY